MLEKALQHDWRLTLWRVYPNMNRRRPCNTLVFYALAGDRPCTSKDAPESGLRRDFCLDVGADYRWEHGHVHRNSRGAAEAASLP